MTIRISPSRDSGAVAPFTVRRMTGEIRAQVRNPRDTSYEVANGAGGVRLGTDTVRYGVILRIKTDCPFDSAPYFVSTWLTLERFEDYGGAEYELVETLHTDSQWRMVVGGDHINSLATGITWYGSLHFDGLGYVERDAYYRLTIKWGKWIINQPALWQYSTIDRIQIDTHYLPQYPYCLIDGGATFSVRRNDTADEW
jgi:hypothetical protein